MARSGLRTASEMSCALIARRLASRPSPSSTANGRLALAWPEDEVEPADQDGVERPLPDLLIVDLTTVAEPLSLYDTAYAAFYSK
jgi:hypothetical protein